MACRSSGTPAPGGYWLPWPAMIAAAAASAISRGPSTSGKPWPRLTAPVVTASADISAKIVVPIPASRALSSGRFTLTWHHAAAPGVMSGTETYVAGMRVALSHLPVSPDPSVNLGRVREALADAAGRGADLAVFPEATQARFGSDLRAAAEPLDGAFGTGLSGAAQASGGALGAGGVQPPA